MLMSVEYEKMYNLGIGLQVMIKRSLMTVQQHARIQRGGGDRGPDPSGKSRSYRIS